MNDWIIMRKHQITNRSTSFLIAPLFAYLSVRTIYRKLFSKGKPWITCLFDSLLEIPYLMKLGPFSKNNDIDSGIQDAMKSTNLSDLGDNISFVSKVYSISRQIGLKHCKCSFSPTGYLISKVVILKRMEIRLKLINYMKKKKHIFEQSHEKECLNQFRRMEEKKPIFIIGLPRTGSTLLHEMLCLHPDVKKHQLWEQISPIPVTMSETPLDLIEDRKLRYHKNKFQFELLSSICDQSIQAIHRIGYDEIEECTQPCGMVLPWAITELPLAMMASKETLPLGTCDTFQFYRQFLQLLSWQRQDECQKRWILKCPFYLPYLQELQQEFRDSPMIWIHRHPVAVIGSSCSLHYSNLCANMNTWTIDKIAFGHQIMIYTKLCIDKARQYCQEEKNNINNHNHHNQNSNIIHIQYKELIHNPIENCLKIFRKLQLRSKNKNIEKTLENYINENLQKRKEMSKSSNIFSLFTSFWKSDNQNVLKRNTPYQTFIEYFKNNNDKNIIEDEVTDPIENLQSYNLEEYGLSEELILYEFKDYILEYNL